MTAWIPALLALTACSSTPAHRQDPGAAGAQEEGGMVAATFRGLEWRGIGPALMSGRIADVAIHPERRSTWYVAVGSGGVWKTVNSGTTWTPLFDEQPSYSIGCVAVDPVHHDVVWVGTGENVGGRHVGFGDGVYKSADGGGTWARVGLERSGHIGRILIDPRDTDVVFVAAQGPLWSGGGDRGLYKTTDGGASWNRVLAGGEYTGVNDVVMDPADPDVLYASTHQRLRNVAALINGGPETGIHKSVDGGETWRELTTGLPEEDMGRIGLAVSPHDPKTVYATIELANRKGGFWRSTDGGESWEKRSDYLSGGTGPHYYQEIWACPHRAGRVYQGDVWLHVTEDGGATFRKVGEEHKHSDNHAMAFVAGEPDYLLVGCDGGLYESFDRGTTWKFVSNLPVTQFYKVALDDEEPFYNVYGGTQDNNTQGGPSRTDNVQGIRNSDWFITLFGDGHQPAVEPGNPDILYSEWQEGNLVRYDRKTGEIVYIQPQPAEEEESERFNWDAPILISPHDPKRLFYASQRVWRSDDRGDSWTAISGDLSRGIDRLEEPMMGRVFGTEGVWDLWAMSKYGTVTSLAQSPVDEDVIYAGTDDGLVQVTEDGGDTWRKVDSLPGIANFFFVNDVKADLFDADTAYLCVDQHKNGDLQPYVYRTTDRGRTWTSMAGDLPDRHLVWRIVQDHVAPGLFFLGTEFGVFFTVDAGERWVKLEGGAPTIPFRDLAIQRRENDLVGATFGRGFYVLDDYTPLRTAAAAVESEAALFPVRRAWWYLPRSPLGAEGKAFQGDAYFTAENPPFGAVFTYFLKDELKTRSATRKEREAELAEAGEDTPYPGWDALLEEELEDAPRMLLTVSIPGGEVVRHIDGPTTAGFHRVAWDLRLPKDDAWKRDEGEPGWFDQESGYLAPPGTYEVRLSKRVDGRWSSVGEPRTFEVVPMRTGTLEGATPDEAAAFQAQLARVTRDRDALSAALGETLERVGAIRSVLVRSTADLRSLDGEARRIERSLRVMKLRLTGSERRDLAGDPGPVSVNARINVAMFGNRWSTYGPTPTHRASLDIARRRIGELRSELERFRGEDLPQLEQRLDDAGVPWTPGR